MKQMTVALSVPLQMCIEFHSSVTLPVCDHRSRDLTDAVVHPPLNPSHNTLGVDACDVRVLGIDAEAVRSDAYGRVIISMPIAVDEEYS
jgi:hypothetical protein